MAQRPTLFRRTFLETYSFDGYDASRDMVNGDPVVKVLRPHSVLPTPARGYAFSLRTMLTSYFGVADRMRKNGKSTGRNIAEDFFFWPAADAPLPQKIFQWLAAISLIPAVANLLSMILTTLVHTLMLATEFLPLALKNYFYAKFEASKRDHDDGNKAWLYLGRAFAVLHFIGRAITSPITNIRMIFKDENRKMSFGLKALLVGLSSLITIAAYTILLPLGVKLAVTNILPYLPTVLQYLPTAAQTIITQLLSSNVFSWLKPVADFIMGPALLADVLGLSPLLATLGTLIGAAATLIGTPVNIVLNFVLNKFFTNSSSKPEVSLASESGVAFKSSTGTMLDVTPPNQCCADEPDVSVGFASGYDPDDEGGCCAELEAGYEPLPESDPEVDEPLSRNNEPLYRDENDAPSTAADILLAPRHGRQLQLAPCSPIFNLNGKQWLRFF